MKTNERSELLLGKEALETLNDKTVLVVGVGGVGSFCVEALARTGIGHLILIDKDCVEPSNINRQLVATLDTVNEVKVDVLKKRISTLNPNCIVDTYACFYDQTKELLEELGYVCEGRLLNTVHYGVPQKRKRVIILGVHKNVIGSHKIEEFFPTPTTLDESQQVSVFEAIADLEHVIPNEFIEKPSTTNRYLDQINKY